MYNRFTALVALCSLFVSICEAQQVERHNGGIKTTVDAINIDIQFYTPSIVRVIKSPQNRSFEKESLSVIKNRKQVPFEVKSQVGGISVLSEALQVDLNTSTGKLSFRNRRGEVLLSEKDHGTQFTPVMDVNKPSFAVRQAFLLDKEEVIYGLGQHLNGRLNQRGQKIFMRQENMRICIPVLQSVKGYGLFWDNYSATTFTDNIHETAFDSELGEGVDYYFLGGGGADQVISQMRYLTGDSPMLPLWSYGFIQSRERYKNQFELVDVVKRYRALKIPLDGIIQDWQYWGPDSNWNAMSFAKTVFPRPKAMIDSVHEMNARIFIVAWPGFGPATKQHKEFKEKNMLLDFDTWPSGKGVRPYDVFNPQARSIYWNYLQKGVYSLGNDAWWLDSTEPDHHNIKEKDWDVPTYLGTYRNVVNAFPLQHTRGVYEHQRKMGSDKRVLLLTRSAFAGQQQFGSVTWSGDVRSDWATLQRQVPAAINFSLSGIPYWNSDIGGFFASHFLKDGGAKNPEFQELYTRWLQFATFTPMMRSHGSAIPREIYQFGERGEWPFDVQEKFINLRYSMLPYIYSTAWDVSQKSGSFLRALYSAFPADKRGFEISNQFLFGKSLLVVPVTGKDVNSQDVYLPAGSNWFDFWTGERISGNQTISRKTPINIIPLYVKSGSILPIGPKVQYAKEKNWNNLELRIYSGADADFSLYEDEGDSYNYEQGKYSEISLHWDDRLKTLKLDRRKGAFPGMLEKRTFKVLLIEGNKRIKGLEKTVHYEGKALNLKF